MSNRHFRERSTGIQNVIDFLHVTSPRESLTSALRVPTRPLGPAPSAGQPARQPAPHQTLSLRSSSNPTLHSQSSTVGHSHPGHSSSLPAASRSIGLLSCDRRFSDPPIPSPRPDNRTSTMALGSGQTQPGNSKLYLYSFISTLLVILLLSLLFSLRLVLRRRKLRLLLDDARREGWGRERVLQMANARGVRLGSDLRGVLDAHGSGGATIGGRRGKREVKLGKVPELFEVQLDDEKVRLNVEEWQVRSFARLCFSVPLHLAEPTLPFHSSSRSLSSSRTPLKQPTLDLPSPSFPLSPLRPSPPSPPSSKRSIVRSARVQRRSRSGSLSSSPRNRRPCPREQTEGGGGICRPLSPRQTKRRRRTGRQKLISGGRLSRSSPKEGRREESGYKRSWREQMVVETSSGRRVFISLVR